MSVIVEYKDALERLRKGDTLRVPAGTRISNDAVSLEAGRGKGTIKKSRASFDELIRAIEAAAKEQEEQILSAEAGPQKAAVADEAKVTDTKNFRMYQEALGREVSLLYENQALKEERDSLRTENENLKAELAALKRTRGATNIRRER
ncbi:hypothetical protein AB4Y35_18365 [Paraburkholderia sp. EG286A]|uniref:hypothetical protein n=1 Tax=Paraburkholderia sp. EG286A TaxID=3237014 RepID=UPI0034D32C51